MAEIWESPPSPDAVRAAVAETGDPELAAWTARPGSFVLRPAERQGSRTALFHVVLVEVPHAMGFLVAVDPASGRVTVTSGRPEAVRRVIATDPALGDPASVWELIRGGAAQGDLVDAARTGEGYEFRVRDRDTGEVGGWAFSPSATSWTPVG